MVSFPTKARQARPQKHVSAQSWEDQPRLQKFEFLTKMSAACTVPAYAPESQDRLPIQRHDARRGEPIRHLNQATGWRAPYARSRRQDYTVSTGRCNRKFIKTTI